MNLLKSIYDLGTYKLSYKAGRFESRIFKNVDHAEMEVIAGMLKCFPLKGLVATTEISNGGEFVHSVKRNCYYGVDNGKSVSIQGFADIQGWVRPTSRLSLFGSHEIIKLALGSIYSIRKQQGKVIEVPPIQYEYYVANNDAFSLRVNTEDELPEQALKDLAGIISMSGVVGIYQTIRTNDDISNINSPVNLGCLRQDGSGGNLVVGSQDKEDFITFLESKSYSIVSQPNI